MAINSSPTSSATELNGDNTVASVVEIHTITGGTGRFAEATGSFIRTYLLDLVTGATAGSFDGTLVLH